MLGKLLDKLRPKISAREQEIIDSIKTHPTLRMEGGRMVIDAIDVEASMRALEEKTRGRYPYECPVCERDRQRQRRA